MDLTTQVPPSSTIIVQLMGRMLDDKVGIYAIRLYFYEPKTEHKIGPEMIDFDR